MGEDLGQLRGNRLRPDHAALLAIRGDRLVVFGQGILPGFRIGILGVLRGVHVPLLEIHGAQLFRECVADRFHGNQLFQISHVLSPM